MANHAADATASPSTLWVRHGGALHELPIGCPDMWPYNVAAFRRDGPDRGTADRPPLVLINFVDGTEVTVTGAGTRDDPMMCAEMEDQPLPQCTCEQTAMSDGEPDAATTPPLKPRRRLVEEVPLPPDSPL